MKIQFQEDTFIRNNLGLPVADPIGIIYKGTVLNVEDKYYLAAFSINNNDRWYRDGNGWYYWSGGTELVPADANMGMPVVVPPVVITVPPVAVTPPPAPLPPTPPLPTGISPVVAIIPPESQSASQRVETMVFFDTEHLPEGFSIPDGETRYIPSVAETPQKPMVREDPGEMIPRGEVSDVDVSVPADRGRDSDPVLSFPDPAFESIRSSASSPPAVTDWSNLSPQKINWGIQHNALPRDWWQQRGLTGKGIRIALLSTGADLNHPDLAGSLESIFTTLADSEETFDDRHGLGTQAAVIAAGRGKLAFGVAPESTLLIGQVGYLDQEITPASLLAGLEWAIDNGADIVAMLVDFRDLPDAEKQVFNQLINRAKDRNVLLVAPVGNSLERRPEERFPAALEGVLSVGAHDVYGKRCAFSAKSYKLDLLAPGEGLLTSGPQQNAVDNLKTSAIAAAYVAGFLALVRQWEREHNRLFAPASLLDMLRNSAEANKTITKGDDVEFGFGILNPAAMLHLLETK